MANYLRNNKDNEFVEYVLNALHIRPYVSVIIDKDYIFGKAKENIELNPLFDQSKYVIISCGRIDPVKQFHLIPSIANLVMNKTNIPFKWYIIGGDRNFESYKDLIIQEINKYNLSDVVQLLGEQSKTHIINKCPISCIKTAKNVGSKNPVLSVASISVKNAKNKKDKYISVPKILNFTL